MISEGGNDGSELCKVCSGMVVGVDSGVKDIFNKYLFLCLQIHIKLLIRLISLNSFKAPKLYAFSYRISSADITLLSIQKYNQKMLTIR